MQMLTLLPDELARRLAWSKPPGTTIRRISAAECDSAVLDRAPGLLVVDPTMLRLDSFERLLHSIARTGCRFVLYCPANRLAAQRILSANLLLPAQVVFQGALRESELIERIVINGHDNTAAMLVVHHLARRISALSRDEGEAVMSRFVDQPVRSVEHGSVLSTTLVSRSARRHLTKSGLAPVRQICAVARVVRAFDEIRYGECTVSDAAERVGYRDERSLEAAFARIVAFTPAASRSRDPNDVARAAAAHLMR